MIEKLFQNSTLQKLNAALGKDAELHLVGGSVRDALLGIEPNDFDCSSIFDSEKIQETLNTANIEFFQLGWLTTAIIDGINIQITPFAKYAEGATLEKDLLLRDFTVNAFALCLNTGKTFSAPTSHDDLANKIVRCPSEARLIFLDDPVRILRMVRFGPAQGRTIDPETFQSAKERAIHLELCSIERIRDEFVKILLDMTPENCVEVFRIMNELNLWEYICPEFKETIGCEQNFHHIFTVDVHIANVIANVPREKVIRLAAFFHDIAKPRVVTTDEKGVRHFLRHEDVGAEMVLEIGPRLRLSDDETKAIAKLVLHHMRPIKMGAPGVRRLMSITSDLFPLWQQLKIADKTAGKFNAEEFKSEWDAFLKLVERVKEIAQRHPFDTLAINGKDVMALGVKQGPVVGGVLRTLQEKVFEDPELNTLESLTKIAKELLLDLERGI